MKLLHPYFNKPTYSKALILCIVFGFFNLACFWDYDTVQMERQQFPNIIELISGKFLRHSPEFYYWRIKDREEKLKKDPNNLAYFDDLAVSYSKIGNDSKAIDIILQKDKIKPNLYETYANLGTFYLHNNQFDKGIVAIKKAIKINPQAHFGREVYQLYLAQYIQSKMVDGKITLPLSTQFNKHPDYSVFNSNGFYSFISNNYRLKLDSIQQLKYRGLPEKEIIKAIQGVTGMMKFGNHDSPILLEALGDLLLGSGNEQAARQLAARAYLKASYEVDAEKSKAVYRKRITFILYHQVSRKEHGRVPIEKLEVSFKEELLQGKQFYQAIKDKELNWIKTGKNPELSFSKEYYIEPKVSLRIQPTVSEQAYDESEYFNDTSIGKFMDYVLIPKMSPELDIQQQKLIDSSFLMFLKKETPNTLKTEEKAINIQEKNNNNTIYYIVPILLLTLIGFIVFIKKNKK